MTRTTIILLWGALGLLASYQILQRTTLSTDLSVFMPSSQSDQTDTLLTQLTAGPAA